MSTWTEEQAMNEPVYNVSENESSEESERSEGDDLKKEKLKGRELLSHKADYYPMRFISIPLRTKEIYLNPFTSAFGFFLLWGLSIWCMVDPEGANDRLTTWQATVTEKFTWFYIVANPAFTFFVFWIAIRYGDIKLGKKDEEPEFDDLSYFMMLFSAGVAVGLFFFGVSEPLSHRASNWFAEAGYRSQDEIDQWALMLTMYHWGFAGWSPYIVVAVAAGIAAYRFDLPMTVRSSLYQVMGPYTWGWLGDLVDGFSIVMTVAGVCTSLGLGSMQIITGAQRLGWMETDLEDNVLTNKQVMVIWVITAIATISVVSGLSVGIKLLSQIGFGLGMLLLFLCLVMDKTNYIFNLTVQTIGYYFQYCIFLVPFWTDAFGQLEEGEGRATDGNSANPQWMNWWTVFYMAWWTAWGAFVGLFLARISRGRTIRQVAIYSFIAPLVYSFIWFCTFGGIGLRQARQAAELEVYGNETFGDPAYFLVDGSDVCYNVPQGNIYDDSGNLVFVNTVPGVTPVCQADTDATQRWFNVMFSFTFKMTEDFAGFGGFMAGLSLIALSIYFITSSDSGSLIVDHLASNGHEDHHWLQRALWAFTEGGVATALLMAGGSDALNALQAGAIIFGLPFNVLLFCMMWCTVKMCNVAEMQDKAGEVNGKLPAPEETSFKMSLLGGVFNIFEYIISLGQVHEDRVALGMDKPSVFQVKEFFIGLLLPFYSLHRILRALDISGALNNALTLAYFSFYAMWIVFFSLTKRNIGYTPFGWSCFFINACILTYVRMQMRARYSLDGNIVADFLAGSFFYPQAMCQMLVETSQHEEASEEVFMEAKSFQQEEDEPSGEIVMEAEEAVAMEDVYKSADDVEADV